MTRKKARKMSKILYAAGTYSHIKAFHLDYIEALRALGHEVYVMAKGSDADFDVAFEKKMLSVRNLSCQKKIRAILKAENFDAIILNTTLAAFNIRMALPKKSRPKVINIVHGYMFQKDVSGLKAKIFLFCEKFLKSKTDHVIVMNQDDYELAHKYLFCKGKVLMSLGMGAKVPPALRSAEQVRGDMACSDKYVICFVGEICRAKNQHLLVSLLPRIKEFAGNAVLWLLGDGAAVEEIRALARELGVSDSVHLMGRVSDPCDYVRACDLYVAPSDKEGLPFNVIEALGCEKTIIATDIKGHTDLIEDGTTGFLYQKGNESELYEKIKGVYDGQLSVDKEKLIEKYKTFEKDNVFPKTLGSIIELLNS